MHSWHSAAPAVTAHHSVCAGFVLCGAATASVVFAAACQTFTALLSRFVLRRTLRAGQVAAVGSLQGWPAIAPACTLLWSQHNR